MIWVIAEKVVLSCFGAPFLDAEFVILSAFDPARLSQDFPLSSNIFPWVDGCKTNLAKVKKVSGVLEETITEVILRMRTPILQVKLVNIFSKPEKWANL